MRLFLILSFSLFWLKANGQQDKDSSAWEMVIPIEIADTRATVSNIVKLSRKDFLSMPASFDDPSRLLIKFPGFSNPNDQNNGIIYHGMPSWMSGWSLYGAEILSPNHLSTAGTFNDLIAQSSGGVNAFSGQVIGEYEYRANPDTRSTSDYFAGVSNIKLRDPYKNQFSFNTSLIGLESGLDLKGRHFNFLSNARYSTVGLLSKLGVDFDGEEINYQDITAKLGFNKGMVNIDSYILVGSSSNQKEFNLENPINENDLEMRSQDENILIIGTHLNVINDRSSFELTTNYSKQKKINNIESLGSWAQDNQLYQQRDLQLISTNSSLHLYRDKIDWEINYRIKQYGSNGFSDEIHQAAIFNKFKFTQHFYLNSGISWNLYWTPNFYHKPNISLGLNWADPKNQFQTELKFSTNNQVGYLPIARNQPNLINLSLNISDLKRSISYSIFYHNFLNLEYFGNPLTQNFFSEQNRLNNNFFLTSTKSNSFIFGGTLKSSKKFTEDISTDFHCTFMHAKQTLDDIKYNLPHAILYNSSFILKHSKFFDERLSLNFSLNLHSGFNTGNWSIYSSAFSERTPFYMRSDLRLNFIPHGDNKGYKSMISLDIQNITNRKNVTGFYYDKVALASLPVKQLGILPVLSWRIVI